MITNFSAIFSMKNINIETMTVSREAKGKRAITVLEIDERNDQLLKEILLLPHIFSASYFE